MTKARKSVLDRVFVGQRFGKYEVLGTDKVLPSGIKEVRMRPACLVKCECGTERVVRTSALLSGRTHCCGKGPCTGHVGPGTATYKHGQRSRPGYGVWNKMRLRCTDPTNQDYPDYGGRGIKVCDRWLNSPKDFLDDMGPRPEGHSVDRIDFNGDYEPGNCRWADDFTQARNRRNTVMVQHQGRRIPLIEACEITGQSYNAARARVQKGWDPELALTTPLLRKQTRFRHAAE